MPTVYVTRRHHFSAAHRLHSDALSDEENKSIFGLCNNPLGHGHNYEIEVTVRGEPDATTGMVIDLKVLKSIIEKEIIDKVDHKHLNFDVDFMRGIVPTAENIAIAFWRQIVDKLPSGELAEIKVYETPRNVAIYRGE
jgi:6-pyruvoyltetrahydropterin/6-carboxytetrahydropterin synthase